MTDTVQDTGEFLALDVPNAALAADNVRLREDVVQLRAHLVARQRHIHTRLHGSIPADYEACDWATCGMTRELLVRTG